MNNDGYKTRSLLTSSVVTPSSTVIARRKLVGLSLSKASIEASHTYIDEPDLFHDGGVYHAYLGAPGEFKTAMSGWRQTNAGDSDVGGGLVVRIFAPFALGDTGNGNYLYVYMTENSGDVAADELSSPTKIINTASYGLEYKPMLKSRPGVFVNSKGNAYIYYQTVDDTIVCFAYSDGSWGSPQIVATNLDVAGNPVTIAPIEKDDIVIYYRDTRTSSYRVSRWLNGVLQMKNEHVNYHHVDYVTGFEHHMFDAEHVGNSGKILMVANNNAFGGSRYYTSQDGVVSGSGVILPIDDVDWTGTLMVYSLSKSHNVDGEERIFAVAQQRFMQGNGEYSQPLTTILWTNENAMHWSQSKYHAVTLRTMPAKVIPHGDYLMLISPTQIMIGVRTADFGGASSLSEVDVSNAVISWTVELSEMNAATVKVDLKASGLPIFETEDWIKYFDEVVIYVGAIDVSGGFETYVKSRVTVAQVVTTDYSNVIDDGRIGIKARGPIGNMLATIQFTDEILTRAIDERYDMNNNDIINRGGSAWEARDGWLVTKWPNSSHESMAMNASPIRGEFFVKVQFKYGLNSSSAGVIFFADTNSEYGDEYQDHNHYMFVLEEAESIFEGLENKCPRIYRRRGEKNSDGEWSDTLELMAEGDTYGYATGTNYKFSVQFIHGMVYVFREDMSDPVLVWEPTDAIPKEYLCGVYARTTSAVTTASAMPNERAVIIDDSSEFMDSGDVKIGKSTYGYTKNGLTLSLDRGLDAFVSEGETVTPADDTVSFNWFQVNSGEDRYSVADVFRHIAARADIVASVNRTAAFMGMDKVFGEYTVETLDDEPYYKIGDVDTLFLTKTLMNNSAVEAKYMNFNSIDGGDVNLEIRMKIGAMNSGYGVSVKKVYGDDYDVFVVKKYDDTADDFSSGVIVRTNRIIPIPSSGTIRVVVSEGYIHLYSNGTYMASAYIESIKNASWIAGIGGRNVDINDYVIEAGNDVMLPGIWDSTTQAKRIVTEMLKGRPIVFIETENGGVLMQQSYHHSDIGGVNLDRMVQVAYGKSWNQPGSALLLQGGYDWTVNFSEEMLKTVGLTWKNVENHTLMSAQTMLQYAKNTLLENEASVRGYTFIGRYDPVMTPTDSFSVRNFRSFDGGRFAVKKLAISYKSPSGNKSPSLTAKGTAISDPQISDIQSPR